MTADWLAVKGKCDVLFSCRSIAFLLISNYLFIVSYPFQGPREVSRQTFLFDIKETLTSYAPVAVVVSSNNSQQKARRFKSFYFYLLLHN